MEFHSKRKQTLLFDPVDKHTFEKKIVSVFMQR